MHTHIKRDDRVCIALLLQKGFSHTEIARELNFHRTTITREIKRNSTNSGTYYVKQAHKKAVERRKDSKNEYRLIDTNKVLKKEIVKYFKKDWSPEQIDGRLNLASFMTIYRFVNRNPELKKYLRRQGKKRRVYGTKGMQSRYQANKRSIHERSKLLVGIGHWEGDTIVGKERKLRIVTHVDKVSGYLVAELITGKADDIHAHTKNKLTKFPCQTITYDNGSEFALHQLIERDTGATVYFADPGKPQQRGCNENANGLLRQYFPKGSSFATIDNKDVVRAVRRINNRPRKRLNYLTPKEVFKGVQFRC